MAKCSKCKKLIKNLKAKYIPTTDETVCMDCYYKYYEECEECGKIVKKGELVLVDFEEENEDDSFEIIEKWICKECY